MSSIEERLARDIAAVTGGVVVTESDLREAREALDERIDQSRTRDRRRLLTAVAAAAVVVPVLGFVAFRALDSQDRSAPPATPAPTVSTDADSAYLDGGDPTPELIEGVWREDNGGTLLRFEQDGTVQVDTAGTLFSAPLVTADYEIDGDLITVTIPPEAQSECSGTGFVLRASLPKPGLMRSVRADDTRGECSPMEVGWEAWEQVLPTSDGMASLRLPSGNAWTSLPGQEVLAGDWLAEGGGYVLEINPNGAYYVADDSGEPVDTGQWAASRSTLTLTSASGSAECSSGDELVLAVRWVDPANYGTSGLRGSVQENACGAPWTPTTWILIPNEGLTY